jgi:preprotein translocase subunit SecE
MAEVQTQSGASSFKDGALLTFSILAILGGIAAFYWYDEQALLIRVAMVVAGVAAGAALAWFSSYGHDFLLFATASRIELRKVVWPGREDTVRTTLTVFVFAVAMGFFFWGLDWLLTFMTRFLGGTSG